MPGPIGAALAAGGKKALAALAAANRVANKPAAQAAMGAGMVGVTAAQQASQRLSSEGQAERLKQQEDAKRGAEISTGEPMDMAWRLLKSRTLGEAVDIGSINQNPQAYREFHENQRRRQIPIKGRNTRETNRLIMREIDEKGDHFNVKQKRYNDFKTSIISPFTGKPMTLEEAAAIRWVTGMDPGSTSRAKMPFTDAEERRRMSEMSQYGAPRNPINMLIAQKQRIHGPLQPTQAEAEQAERARQRKIVSEGQAQTMMPSSAREAVAAASAQGFHFNEEGQLVDAKGQLLLSEPMDIAMRLLKMLKAPVHEMSNDQLDEILYGALSYDAGSGKYTRNQSLSTQEEKEAALQELLARQRETEASVPNLFDLSPQSRTELVDFYEPQFTGRNISPDVFIPQTEKEGQMAFNEGTLDDDIHERVADIEEFMPGKFHSIEEDPMGKYRHLKATAGDEVAENYLNRYRNFVMSQNENPEYVHQRLMQMYDPMFDPSQEVTVPQYTREFPTDETIFDIKPPYVMMNEPDATGYAHNWQAKNASEPMDLAMRLLKMDFSTLQLPHQLSDKMRADVKTLDREHTITDTNEGTLIENIHPDMETVLRMLTGFEEQPAPTVPARQPMYY